MNDTSQTDTVIIGAGPFGLSTAAHLRAAGDNFRIFGVPMKRWRQQMPMGMFLKSEGRASSLSDPAGELTIGRFCAENKLPYDDRAVPVPVEAFIDYGLAFQRRLVPSLEQVLVSRIEALDDGFHVNLDDGTALRTKHVVVATGLDHTEYMPPVFSGLPSTFVSHSSAHHDFTPFSGKDVTVIGGGQSALESAALLREAGAQVRVIVRKPKLQWNEAPRLGRRSLLRRLRYPLSNLGEGLQLWLFSNMPHLFTWLPRRVRIEKVAKVLDAAGAWWLRSRVEGKIQVLMGQAVSSAVERNGRLLLRLSGLAGETAEITTDHVVAATGYHYDVLSLPFLSDAIKKRIRTENHRPILSRDLESSVRGLYFTGVASAYTLGPAMRFVDGVDHTARAISHHIRTKEKRTSAAPAETVVATSN